MNQEGREVAQKSKRKTAAQKRRKDLVIAADRERITHQLQETVGQALYGIGLGLESALQEETTPQRRDHLAKLRAQAASGMAEVQNALHELSFLQVRARGFVPSLKTLTKQFQAATGIYAQFRLEGDTPTLTEDQQGALYRVAHEALVNVERHSRATGVVLQLFCYPDQVVLMIRDDGVGIAQRDGSHPGSSARFGLHSMAKAVRELNGTFKVTSPNPRGVLIRAEIPLHQPRDS